MSGVMIQVDIRGIEESMADLQRIRNAFADRAPMHARLATDVKDFTRKYLVGDSRHATAAKLGAIPTGHRTRIGESENMIEADSDSQRAVLRIPASTGLGRAFHDVTLVPGSGRTYLTVPACARTYGKSVRDFPEGTFKFAIFKTHRGPCPVFLWAGKGGTVAYWLRREIIQKQDRTLLPSDEGYIKAGRESARTYLVNVLRLSGNTQLS